MKRPLAIIKLIMHFIIKLSIEILTAIENAKRAGPRMRYSVDAQPHAFVGAA